MPEVECGGDGTGCTCLSVITLAGLGMFGGLVLALSVRSRSVRTGNVFDFGNSLGVSVRALETITKWHNPYKYLDLV